MASFPSSVSGKEMGCYPVWQKKSAVRFMSMHVRGASAHFLPSEIVHGCIDTVKICSDCAKPAMSDGIYQAVLGSGCPINPATPSHAGIE